MPNGIGKNIIPCNAHFKWWVVYVSVSDPDSLSPDLDPIQIHGFLTKNRKTAVKKLDIFLVKNCNLLIPRHP
jgi:hypothetical protein